MIVRLDIWSSVQFSYSAFHEACFLFISAIISTKFGGLLLVEGIIRLMSWTSDEMEVIFKLHRVAPNPKYY